MVALIEFLGYGPDRPEVLFLGQEESNGSGGDTAIRIRETEFARIEDLGRAQAKLAKDPKFKNPFSTPRDKNPIRQWNAAARLRLALAGVQNWHSSKVFGRYWRAALGAHAGDTFLMERHAHPRPGSHVRLEVDPLIEWTRRAAVLKAFISGISPRFAIAYGDVASEGVGELFEVPTAAFRRVATRKPTSIAKSPLGPVVARVGFFGQGKFAQDDVPALVEAMAALGGGLAPLRHSW